MYECVIFCSVNVSILVTLMHVDALRNSTAPRIFLQSVWLICVASPGPSGSSGKHCRRDGCVFPVTPSQVMSTVKQTLNFGKEKVAMYK